MVNSSLKAQVTSEISQGHSISRIPGFTRLLLTAATAAAALALLKLVEVVGDVGNPVDQHDQTREVTAETCNRQITAFNSRRPDRARRTVRSLDDSHHRVLRQAVGALACFTVLGNLQFKAVLQPGFRGKARTSGKPSIASPSRPASFTF